MTRHLVSLLIIIFFVSTLRGQDRDIVEDMRKILVSKDFIALQAHIDSLSGANWGCLRDLVDGFKEGVVFFGYDVKDKDNPAMGTSYTLKVNIIATTSRIIFYELSERKYKNVPENWIPSYHTLDDFKDDSSYKVLQASFKSIFHTELNEKELFKTDFVYGERCGFGGINPDERVQANEFVATKNKPELLKWLQSSNTEKQIYAVDGLYQLKKLGIKLTEEDLKMIKFVTGKKGTMHVCSGCIYSQEEISDVVKIFKF